MKKEVFIVGSGILGLCLAEFFSRSNNKVTIISNEHSLSGSYAAAANLATKGQIFARDPHFELKLQAKKIYYSWLSKLVDECNYSKKVEDFFRINYGIDHFSNEEDRDKQLKRVLQNKEELIREKLPIDLISGFGKDKIFYQNEAWVDAVILLDLLKSVLIKRNINFEIRNFSKTDLNKIKNSNLFFCTGAWTKELLSKLDIPLPVGFRKSERLSIGSTFYFAGSFQKFLENEVETYPDIKKENIALYEKLSQGLVTKCIFSGNEESVFVSSTMFKFNYEESIEKSNSNVRKLLNTKNQSFLSFANLNHSLQERTGLRVGYGHSELLFEPVTLISESVNAFVCCGAHKSGFLFGPVLGNFVNNCRDYVT